jgi:formylglycine-generating enzyme required for sulfatase activity
MKAKPNQKISKTEEIRIRCRTSPKASIVRVATPSTQTGESGAFIRHEGLGSAQWAAWWLRHAQREKKGLHEWRWGCPPYLSLISITFLYCGLIFFSSLSCADCPSASESQNKDAIILSGWELHDAPPRSILAQHTIPLPLPEGATPLEIVRIPAGFFRMGSPEDEEHRQRNEKQHLVKISRPFYMGKYEVTQAQWREIMGEHPFHFTGDNLPVENVSWNDIQRFLAAINQRGWGTFRLPTEAEWEYACRAGSMTAYPWGNAMADADRHAWFTTNAEFQPHEVGTKAPNAWGLHDMSGNVWEWCADWYGHYSEEAQMDPTGPRTGLSHVERGGSWSDSLDRCRSARRGSSRPTLRHDSIGFRLVWIGICFK